MTRRFFVLITALVLAQNFVAARLMADGPGCPCSIWSSSIDPGLEAIDTQSVNLGLKFHSDVDGYVKGVRFYKHIDNNGAHIGYLWSSTGAMLASATFTNETPTGWQEVAFPTPVAITANTDYIVAYWTENSHWAHNLNYFVNFGVDSPPLHVNAGDGNNGLFTYGAAGQFPTSTNRATNYMVDLVFDTTAGPTTTPLTVATITENVTPGGVDANTNIDITFARETDASSVNNSTIQLLDPSNNPVATTVTYPPVASIRKATIITTPVLSLGTTYRVVVTSSVKDLAGNAATAASATFTTSATPWDYGCHPCSLWTPVTGDGGTEANVDAPVNLGLKFQSDAIGYIKGIRVFIQPGNTGPVSAFLWSATGSLLASKAFPASPGTGWQEVLFDSPVAINRHTTYVAGYQTNGHWAQSRPGYFEESAYVHLPLRALQNFYGVPNGVFADGVAPNGVFPNQDPADSPNYWVDPIFDTTPAPIITSANSTTFTVGTAGNFTVTAYGFPTATITKSGSLPAGTTLVDNGDGTATLSGTPQIGSGGVYPITISATNTAGTSSQNFTLTVNEAPSVTTAAADQTVCNNTNATFSAAATGYPAPLLQWQVSIGGGAFQDITGANSSPLVINNATAALSGNQYRAHFSNAFGAADTTATLTVTTPAQPTITAGGPTTFCQGGSVTLSSSSSTSYQWYVGGTAISGATNQTYSATATGDYTVQVISSACPSTSVATHVTVNPIPATPLASNGGPYCQGGTIQLSTPTVSGATYTWTDPVGFMTHSQNPTIANATTSMSGAYSVTITVNGCTSAAGTTNVVVNAVPPAPTVTAGGPTTFCPGGSVTLTASPASSYLWSTGATTQAITVSTSGSYTVTAISNGCSSTPSSATNVTVNAAPVTPAITAPTIVNANSTGNSASGPDGATSYAWSISNGTITSATNTKDITFTAGTSGSVALTLTVTNAAGCSASNSASVTINPNQPPVANSDNYTTCENAPLAVSGSGVLANDTDAEHDPLTATLVSGPTNGGSLTLNSDGSFNYTPAPGFSGTDTFTYKANDGTSDSAAVSVNIHVTATPATPTITPSGSTTFCTGGSVTLTSSSADSYLWSNGATTQSIVVSASGTYTVAVTTNGCPSASSAPTTVTVNPLPTPTITAGGPTTFCAGGSVTLTASSGSSYLWSNGATTPSITVSASGSYTVQVTNANGCSATSAPTTVTVNPAPTATITAGGPTTFCAGGSVTLTASSGTSYSWSNGATTSSITVNASGNYTVAVTNANGCSATSSPMTVTVNPLPTATITPNGPTTFCAGGSVTLTASSGSSYLWSNGATTSSITVSASGSYTVQVTNADGCSATSAPTTVTVNPLPTATITPSGPTTFCAGGSVTLTANSGSSYLWSNGATTSSITVSASGSYTVQVTNANGCSATSAATTVIVNPTPATPTINAEGPTTFCQGGSVKLTSSPAASYLWSTGETTQSIVVSSSGSYSVTIHDANGCASATSAATNVVVNPTPATPTITTSGATTFCQGGSVTLTSSSTTGNQWFLNGSAINGATDPTYSATISGQYAVQVTTAGCPSAMSAATTVTVNATPATPTITPSGATTFCAGGSVTLTSSSADSYLWSNGATTQSIVVTASGNYTVAVTNNGCPSASSAPTTVTVNPLPTAMITPSGPTTFCAGGSVTLTASSGTSYSWSNGATTPSITVNASGNYTVTVTNANGCSATSAPTSVTVNPLPTATITPSGPTTFCAGGSVTLTASSGTSYSWSNGATTPSITVNASGNYTVTVTNANGCSATSAPTSVTVNPLPTATITPGGPTTFCAGGSVTLTASSGTSYSWSNGATTSSITVNASGNYTVTVTNANGCSATSAPTTVTVNPLPTATITPNGPTTFCQGGSVTLNASSGSSYLWSNGATTSSITVNASGNYTVTVTNANGCSATSAPTSVTVNPLPTATITPNGPTTFCQGGSVMLTASSGASYSWSNGATTQSITVSSSGSYTVTVSNGTCSAPSSPTTVTVNSNPATPSITAPASVAANSGGNTASGPAGASSYAWTISNGTITSAANLQSITFTAGAAGQVGLSLTVTNANGCSASNSANVPVNTPPVANADSYSVVQNSTLNVAARGVLTNDSDADGNALSAVLVSNVTHGSLTLNADGSFAYTPAAGYSGSDSFTYQASDGLANSNVATVSIDVYTKSVTTNVPAGGTATSDTEGNGATTTNPVEASVTLPSGVSGSVTIASGPLLPSDVAPSGYSYFNYEVDITAPPQTPSAPLTFVFLIDPSIVPSGFNKDNVQLFRNGVAVPDCTGAPGTASPDPCIAARSMSGDDISLRVYTSAASRWNCGKSTNNSAPVAANDTYSTPQNTPLTVAAPGVLANDTDADKNTLRALLATNPSHGTVTLNADGSFTYTPNTGTTGADSFTYYANDYTVNSAAATVTINVNSVPSITIADVTAAEGTSTTTATTFAFQVSLSTSSASPVSVTYATADNTALAGEDYTAANGTLTFQPGETTKTINISVTADNKYETNETFYLNLSNPSGATLARTQAVGTIQNDDPQPQITVDNVSAQAPAKGTTAPFNFHITLLNPSYQTITVHYYTSNQTAVAGTDYTSTSGTATFAPGQTSVTVGVPVMGTTSNTQKTFLFNLDTPVNATIQMVNGFQVRGKGTILAK